MAPSPRTAWRCSTRPTRHRAVVVGLSYGRPLDAAPLAADHPERVDWCGGHRRVAPVRVAAGERPRRPRPSDEFETRDELRGLGALQRARVAAATTTGSSSSSSTQCFSEPHSTKHRSRTSSAGRTRPIPRRLIDGPSRRPASTTAPRSTALAARVRCPHARDPRHGRRHDRVPPRGRPRAPPRGAARRCRGGRATSRSRAGSPVASTALIARSWPAAAEASRQTATTSCDRTRAAPASRTATGLAVPTARRPDRAGRSTATPATPTIVFLPSTPIVHARQWKGQVPFLARHYRVVDVRRAGQRPLRPARGRRRLPGRGSSATSAACSTRPRPIARPRWAVRRRRVARDPARGSDPERVLGIVAFAVGVPLPLAAAPVAASSGRSTTCCPPTRAGPRSTATPARGTTRASREFFFSAITTEPHSTKVIDDAVEWACDGSVDAMLADAGAGGGLDLSSVEATVAAVRCPMLLVHGTEDHCQPPARAPPSRTSPARRSSSSRAPTT